MAKAVSQFEDESPEEDLPAVAALPRLNVEPLGASLSLRTLAYDALKKAITEMDIYGHPVDIKLDERRLSQDLGVSRTPIREAMTLLEQEGFVRSVPRRGIFVVRKTKQELLDIITVCAALESMAARLTATRATDAELKSLREMFSEFEHPAEHMHEYSEANIAFHQTVIRLSRCPLIAEMTENLVLHMRAIRSVSLRQDNRSEVSIREHMGIIDALERRDAEAAERLFREHTLGLAAHVEKHGVFPK
jgi:DNA-binding GntR family transcriptional regulator